MYATMSTEKRAKIPSGQRLSSQVLATVGVVSDRKTIRLAVNPMAKEVIERWAQRHSMTELGVASRIFTWFGEQPEEIQRGILGLYGGYGPDIARHVLEEMAGAEGTAKKIPDPKSKAEGDSAGNQSRGRPRMSRAK